MDNRADERDYLLLDSDRYTFFVLRQIMGGNCDLLLTDHEKMIICYSGAPYPVWIWTPDDLLPEFLEQIFMVIKENSLIGCGQRFNVKKGLASYLIRRAEKDGFRLEISVNMKVYDCPAPIRPESRVDGVLHLCTNEDESELAEIIEQFADETNTDRKNREAYLEDARLFIESGTMYFWKNKHGETVASCKFNPAGELASVNHVYTRPEYRRKHFAENLVYEVTRIVRNAGYLPMLYTDSDYVASNACYEKIGYMFRGELCTVSVL